MVNDKKGIPIYVIWRTIGIILIITSVVLFIGEHDGADKDFIRGRLVSLCIGVFLVFFSFVDKFSKFHLRNKDEK